MQEHLASEQVPRAQRLQVRGPDELVRPGDRYEQPGVRHKDGPGSGGLRQPADGSAAATLNTWFVALLGGARGRIRIRGDRDLVDACLTQLHEVVGDRPMASQVPAPS